MDTTRPRRIFISYKRESEEDEQVAAQVCAALSRRHEVFIDRNIPVGTNWAARIDAELQRADFVIAFLSARSVVSEMVLGEINRAYQLAKERPDQRPAILPVRLAYRGPFKYPLNAQLDHINAASWAGPEGTPLLIEQLLHAVEGREPAPAPPVPPDGAGAPPPPSTQPPGAVRLETPGGTMDVDSKFYVERRADALAREAISRRGSTITIEGPRQMGKSSLLVRTAAAAQKLGKRVAFLDFQLLDRFQSGDPGRRDDAGLFFRHFSTWIADRLGLADRVAEFWIEQASPSQCCTRYMERYVLPALDGPLVLAMDEVDNLFDTDFRSTFFAMLRSWHNERAWSPRWKNLDLVLVTSTEPHLFIKNLTQSPFNVADEIRLDDFSTAQVQDLNVRHGSPLPTDAVGSLMDLLHGHPFLVRRALYHVAGGRFSVTDLFARATDDESGPFADHLRHLIYRLHDQHDLARALRQIIARQARPAEPIVYRLRAAGLVRNTEEGVVPRCRLYAEYLGERLHD